MHVDSDDFPSVAAALAKAGRLFYERGWVLGTSGNFSAVLSRHPLRLAITATGLHKGELEEKDFLIVDDFGKVVAGVGKPSAETALHIAIARVRGAGAILHTHSVWATILSERHAASGGFELRGYEMLKGLAQVATHEHCEWIPILENTQSYSTLERQMADLLASKPDLHGIVLRRHGLYTWGRDISEARRHVEIFEFLFEVAGRLNLNAER
jgi:methylthioribulose-1-phosphate dehydratase